MNQTNRSPRAWLRPCGLALLSLGLAACSSVKPYPSSDAPNAVVRAKTDTGIAMISKRAAALDIFTLSPACQLEYLGTLDLDAKPTTEFGLPVGKPVLLNFVFSKASIGGSSSALLEMTVTPVKGARYEFDASHVDALYGASGREFTPGNRAGREIEHKRGIDCVPSAG